MDWFGADWYKRRLEKVALGTSDGSPGQSWRNRKQSRTRHAPECSTIPVKKQCGQKEEEVEERPGASQDVSTSSCMWPLNYSIATFALCHSLSFTLIYYTDYYEIKWGNFMCALQNSLEMCEIQNMIYPSATKKTEKNMGLHMPVAARCRDWSLALWTVETSAVGLCSHPFISKQGFLPGLLWISWWKSKHLEHQEDLNIIQSEHFLVLRRIWLHRLRLCWPLEG